MNSSLAVCVGSIRLSEYFRENICRKMDPFTALVTDHAIVLSWWARRWLKLNETWAALFGGFGRVRIFCQVGIKNGKFHSQMCRVNLGQPTKK